MYFTPTEHKQMIIKRTKLLRQRAEFTQEKMAQILRIPTDTYRNYEYRSLLPPTHHTAFCNTVGSDSRELVSPNLTKFDIELFKWHDENKNCRLLRDDMRPNFVNGKLAPIGLQGEE